MFCIEHYTVSFIFIIFFFFSTFDCSATCCRGRWCLRGPAHFSNPPSIISFPSWPRSWNTAPLRHNFCVKASVVAFGPVQWLQWCFSISRLKCMTFVWRFKRRLAKVLFRLYFPSTSLCHPLFCSSAYWWHIHPSILTSIHPKNSGLSLAGHSPTSQCPSVCLFETYFEHNVQKKRVHPSIFFLWKRKCCHFQYYWLLFQSFILNYE